jgi:hypothetical protein
VGAEDVLRRRALALAYALSIGAAAHAQDDLDGLRRPERLTVGASDQFLGTSSPDGRTLYFASNRNTATEIYSQDTTGGARLLFDEGADVTWPRVSPDGRHLLYISFREDAAGQLCVRELPHGARRCWPDGPGAVQAEWIDPRRLLLLHRPSAQSDMRLSIVEVGPRLSAHTLFDRNLTSPTISPDGHWLVYTPVERYVRNIGPGFAAKAGRELVAQRLDRPDQPPAPIALDVPGLTGQPAFAADGRTLYFVQFMSDSNQDGVIDGADHGVLFRAPFDQSRDDAVAQLRGVSPQQLTDASWNCQYPSPGVHRLIATCTRGMNTSASHLDIYALPLDGVVPTDWNAAHLAAELSVATNPYEMLLLHSQLLRASTDPTARRSEEVSLIRLHLRLDEFDAADFHAKHLAAIKDSATVGLGSAMRALCEHRRALRARERGHLRLDFVSDSRQRLDHLASGKASSFGGAAAHHVVMSEIADVIGDKTRAQQELAAVVLDGITAPAVLELYADRADALYRELDDRHGLFSAYERLARHPALSETDRLSYARHAVQAQVRGLSPREADAALEAIAAPPGSELAFAIELARVSHSILGARTPDEVRDRVIAFYRSDARPERRRAIMLEVMQRGWEQRALELIERLAELYVDDAPKGTIERRRAARLYRRLIEDRAYAHLGAKRTAAARNDFHAVAQRMGSLESWANYFDLAVKEGAKVEDLEAEYAAQHPGERDGSVGRFVRAYLTARRLPKLEGAQAERAVDETMSLIRGTWSQLKEQSEAVSVLGAVQHERFLHTHDRAAAEQATAIYLVALDLSRRNPRYKAMLLEQLGLLQAAVGNWRIALDYFDQREKLPFFDGAIQIIHRLIKARTQLHLDHEAEAAKLADEALAFVERTPRLHHYLPICLDRAALYNLAADRYERAIALYERALPGVEADRGPHGPRNRLVVNLARAAAALGARQPGIALDTLAAVDLALAARGIGRTLVWPHSTERQSMQTYRLMASGLRAKAYLALGRNAEAHAALAARRAVFAERLKREKVDEHVRALALVDSQLAEAALAQHDGASALGHIKDALFELTPVVKKEGKPYDHDELDLLWLAAQARMNTDAKVKLQLRDKLGEGIAALAAQAEAKRRTLQTWLEIYLGLLGSRPPANAALMRAATRSP